MRWHSACVYGALVGGEVWCEHRRSAAKAAAETAEAEAAAEAEAVDSTQLHGCLGKDQQPCAAEGNRAAEKSHAA